VRGSRTHVKQLGKQNVLTMLDAQMSLPYSIAAALFTGGAMLDQYTSSALRREEVNELARRVQVIHETSVRDGEEPYVDVELSDGRMLTGRMKVARGDYTNPLSEDELRAKFRTTAGTVFDSKRVAALEQMIAKTDELADVNELVALLVSRPQGAKRRAAGGGA
jgi:2-methylcitrate dehydratase PrpD